MYEIRYKIKELRKETGITQKALGEHLNKSATAVASWEQGLSEPSVNDIIVMCKLFGVSPNYLFGFED